MKTLYEAFFILALLINKTLVAIYHYSRYFHIKCLNMSSNNCFVYIRSRKVILCLIYSMFISMFIISKLYHSSHLRTNNHNDKVLLQDITTLSDEQRKIRFKKDYHLNIFDFESFKSVKWQEDIHSGPCVNTRIEVSKHHLLIKRKLWEVYLIIFYP